MKREEDAIAEFLSAHPTKACKVKALIKSIQDAERKEQAARKALCKLFGLAHSSGKLEFSRCGDGRGSFVKAGGKIPTDNKRWKYDEVIAELAKVDGKKAKAVLKRYGINWE